MLSVLFCLLFQPSLSGQGLPGPAVPDGLGLNIHTPELSPPEMQALAATGVRWIRMDLFWNSTEHPKGKYDFSAYDRLLTRLQPYNIHALFILDYGNNLYDGGAAPRNPETRKAFTDWAVSAVTHFRGRGIIWEMWNEPNGIFWHPKVNVQDYSALAVQVGEALRKAAPAEILVGPGLGNIDLGFLEACFKAGVLNYWSAVSLHPYRDGPPESADRDYRQVRDLIARYARGRDISVIDSEWGYPAHQPMNGQTQANLLSRMWLFNLSQNIPLSIWYDWVNPGSWEQQSIITLSYNSAKQAVFQPRPGYYAAQTLTSFFNGYRFSKRLPTAANDYVLVFSNGSEQRIAAWTVSPAPHSIVIPVSGKFRVTNNLGKEGSPLTADARGLTVTVSESPQYLQSGTGSAPLPAPAQPSQPAPPTSLTPQQAQALNLAWRNLARAYQDVITVAPDPGGAIAKLKGALGAAIHDLHTVDPGLAEASVLQGVDAGQPRAQVLNAIQQHLDLARQYIAESKVNNAPVQDALGQITLASGYVTAARKP